MPFHDSWNFSRKLPHANSDFHAPTDYSTCVPRLLAAVLFLLAAAASAVVVSDAATIVVTNKCGYTVWPAALPGGGTVLNTGHSCVWGRTGCGFVANGTLLGQCQTGDCGGTLACTKLGFSPATVAEYSLGAGAVDHFDVSLVHGFNAPMSFLPAAGGRCGRGGGPSCPVQEITFNCPSEQRAKAGCNNPCDGKQGSCGPNSGTQYFKKACPQTITYPRDTTNTVYTCPAGTNYVITFCP